jgi:5-methylcytosine-specific restriction protein A
MTRFAHPCPHPGCGVTTRQRYCAKHRRGWNRQDGPRPSAHKRGYNKAWQRYRIGYLIEHPLCVLCEREGRVTAATVVDHVLPHQGDEERFWDEANHMALCARCHSRKTATKDR